MNAFDFSILSFFNQFVGQYPLLDKGVVYISGNQLLRGGAIAALLWWAWFKDGEHKANKDARQRIVASILTCSVSIVIARLIAWAFPFRVRPISDPTNGLQFPASPVDWENWSSFPSDHAILFFAFTTCLFYTSRALGWIAVFDTVFLVCLPRIYLGIHYPSDVLAGACIGVGIAFMANRKAFRSYVAKGAFQWMERHPSSFYASFYLFSYELSVLFGDVRLFAKTIVKQFMQLLTG